MQNLSRLSPIPQLFLTQSMKCLLRYEEWPWILKHVSECRGPFSFSMTTPFQRHGITRINVIVRNMHFASNIFTWCYTHQKINIPFNLLEYFSWFIFYYFAYSVIKKCLVLIKIEISILRNVNNIENIIEMLQYRIKKPALKSGSWWEINACLLDIIDIHIELQILLLVWYHKRKGRSLFWKYDNTQ